MTISGFKILDLISVWQNNSTIAINLITDMNILSENGHVLHPGRAHWPTIECHPMMLPDMQACFLILTPRITVQRESLTPASITQPGPIATSAQLDTPLQFLHFHLPRHSQLCESHWPILVMTSFSMSQSRVLDQ